MHEFISSEDGSHTLKSEQFGVTYHSKHGALQETQIVFLDAALDYQIQRGLEQVSILEMGFGTGLNVIMTQQFIKDKQVDVNVHTIEAYPLSMDIVHRLNYPDVLGLSPEDKQLFYDLHKLDDGVEYHSDKFTFIKSITLLESIQLQDNQYDIIYFDAFSPDDQAELWSEEMMAKLFKSMKSGGCLTTYCAKGAFKRALLSAGFLVEKLPGPKGKREMTRALKP